MCAVWVSGCVSELDLDAPVECALDAPGAVALGQPFTVEVNCTESVAWYEYDFGDRRGFIRTAASARTHTYGAEVEDQDMFRLQVLYTDEVGRVGRVSAIILRRF